jgi:preprotein translocase subunit SecD
MKFLLITTSCFFLPISIVLGQTMNYKLANGWYYIIEEDHGIKLTLDKSNSSYFLDSMPIVVSKNIKEITFQNGNDGNLYLKIQFDLAGTKAWKFATMKSVNRRLGFVFNNKLIQAPKVNSEIDFGVAAIWDYTKDELSLIKSVLESEYTLHH